ncbi:MAG: hypothetical protein O9972_48815 [Burkholderiales bacterium]|jgi:uncharacterized protein YgbK (DUF1537 family)|nr:hypothetical protein [Burkholderiales bacterium]
MTSLRLLADDLTGALDSAAPFAALGPVQVAWSEDGFAPGRRLRALDGQTRDLPAALARERVGHWLEHVGSPGIAFKKIDSLLRGNTVVELEACCRSRHYATVVVAPAFPSQHRITTGGVQKARAGADVPWRKVGPGLTTVLHGARRIPIGGSRGGAGIVVCDAETQDDLDLIARCPDWEKPVLWCGTSGLARALSGSPPAIELRRIPGLLVLMGSTHPTTRAQLALLEQACPGTLVEGDGLDPAGTAVRLAERLAFAGLASLGATDPHASPGAADWFRAAFEKLVAMSRPDLVVCGGGDTARRLCKAAGAASLLVDGEWRPGFPVARIDAGPWAGVRLITKAGAFGSPESLLSLAGSMWEGFGR